MLGKLCFAFTVLVEITIPNSVTVIGEYAFYQCKTLKRVFFQENSKLKSIENGSFCQTGLEEINIPNSVVNIGDYAFQECVCLKTVTF